MLRIDGLIFTVINIFVIYFVLRKFLFKPIQNVIDAREKKISDSYKEAEDTKNEAEKAQSEYEEKMRALKQETLSKLKKADEDAQKIYDKKVDEAKIEAEEIISEAHKSVERDKNLAMRNAQTEIAELAIAVSRKVLSEGNSDFDKDAYEKMIEDAKKKNVARS